MEWPARVAPVAPLAIVALIVAGSVVARSVSEKGERAPSRPAPPARNGGNLQFVPREARLLGAREALLRRAPGAQSDPSWRQPFDPIRIAGNVYYVGTRGLSSFLIVTPAGGVIIDSGEAESVPFIRANVDRLAFRMSEIKILLAGHAHFDHIGGHAEMKRLTGAQVVVMDADRQAMESGVDRSALGAQGWAPVKIDRVVKDGDTVSLGGTTLTAHLTPGHTQGCTTWTTEVTQDGRRLRVAFVCSVTVNKGVHLVPNARVPAIAGHYAQAFRVLHGLTPDVFVAEHGGAFGLEAKAEKARDLEKGQPNPFVDPQGYQRFVARAEEIYLAQLRAEKK